MYVAGFITHILVHVATTMPLSPDADAVLPTVCSVRVYTKYCKYIYVRARMDENGMKLWINRIWLVQEESLSRLYDMFKAHLMESIKTALSKLNTDVVIIPGGLTVS